MTAEASLHNDKYGNPKGVFHEQLAQDSRFVEFTVAIGTTATAIYSPPAAAITAGHTFQVIKFEIMNLDANANYMTFYDATNAADCVAGNERDIRPIPTYAALLANPALVSHDREPGRAFAKNLFGVLNAAPAAASIWVRATVYISPKKLE